MTRSKLGSLMAIATITTLAFIFAAGCHKADKTSTEDTGYAGDQAVSEKTFEDAQTIADQGAITANGNLNERTTGSGCATVSHTISGTDSVITIDFGTTDCLCHDLSTRRGQIIVTYSGAYAATGGTHTITFNNFYQNDNQVTGSKTVTNMGTNALGQIYFNVTINGSIILASGAGTISASWTRVRTWISEGTPDIYQVSGSGTLTRANGTEIAVSIPTATPLQFASDCRYIESGAVDYTLSSGLTRSLNYGNTPVCDDQAVLTLASGATIDITLR